MTMIRKVMPAQVNDLPDDEVEVVISTGDRARDGHIFVPQGAELGNYRKNPIVLWQHDPEHPVARAEDVNIDGDKIVARIRFAPAGISPKADEIRGLVKSGIISTMSVGMNPVEMEPLDPAKPRGGQRMTKWEMLECSFCSVPVDTGAVVTARAVSESDWQVGAPKDLPIEDSDEWDGSAAEESIFALAGGDDFDPAKARKGFLVYDATKPKERGSYKLPIAHVVDGELKVPKGAIRAAASRLPQADIPEATKTEAGEVLDHYKEKAGMERSLESARKRMLVENPDLQLRDLYDVANLAYALQNLGYIQACSEWESEIEGDNSQVPAMLGEALKAVGDALIAMTSEEVAELIGGTDEDDIDGEFPPTDRAYVAAAENGRLRAWRRGLVRARLRAGKVLSAANKTALQDAHDKIEEARCMVRSVIDAAEDKQDDDASEGGTADRSLSADYRRRQAELLAFIP